MSDWCKIEPFFLQVNRYSEFDFSAVVLGCNNSKWKTETQRKPRWWLTMGTASIWKGHDQIFVRQQIIWTYREAVSFVDWFSSVYLFIYWFTGTSFPLSTSCLCITCDNHQKCVNLFWKLRLFVQFSFRFDFYMKIHDVQTLAMLVCVLWNRENAIVNPPKKDRALPQSTSMDYVPPCVSYIVVCDAN